MSALPLPNHGAPAAVRRRPVLRLAARPTSGARPPLPATPLVAGAEPGEDPDHGGHDAVGRLAPTSRAQAWGRRALALLVVLATATAVAVAAAAAWSSGSTSAGVVPTVPVSDVTAVVEPGETIWDVAERHVPPGSSVADYVARIVELNGVDPGAVDEWQVLRLP